MDSDGGFDVDMEGIRSGMAEPGRVGCDDPAPVFRQKAIEIGSLRCFVSKVRKLFCNPYRIGRSVPAPAGQPVAVAQQGSRFIRVSPDVSGNWGFDSNF
jgi:hypothetical protein